VARKSNAEIVEMARQVILNMPKRIIVDKEGTAVPPHQSDRGVDVVFIRVDGWSLGADSELAAVAASLWEGSWVAQMTMRFDGERNLGAPLVFVVFRYQEDTPLAKFKFHFGNLTQTILEQ